MLLIIIHLLLVGAVSKAPLLFATLSPTSQGSVVKSCRTDEYASLLAFKAAFTLSDEDPHKHDEICGKSYAKTESWKNGSSDCCQWDGVTCDPSSGHVTELDLSCSFLNGSFPSNSTLFHLRHLRRINLAYNDFSWSSSIPPSFGQLSHLTYLNLSWSGFSGNVPREIGWLFQLSTLDLSQLAVEVSNCKKIFANLTELRELDLSGTSIESDLLPVIANLSKLVSLKLLGSGLQGEFPMASVLSMPNLRVLCLGSNDAMYYDFSTSPVRWSSPLEVVDFSHSSFTGKLPDFVGGSSNFSMRSFDITSCGFHGDIPSWMWNVKEEIRASSNRLSGTLPPTMNTSTLGGLSVIEFISNMITGMIPVWLFSLPTLNSLYLSENLFTGLSQSSIANGSSSSSKLVHFRANDNHLQGKIPQVIFVLRNLQTLQLERNKLIGNVWLSQLHNLQNLDFLGLSNNNLSIIDDMGVNITSSWPQFSYLELSSCNLGHFPSFLREQVNLQQLDLSDNGIHGLVPKWFLDIGTRQLSYLSLSHNSLTGGLEHLPWQKMTNTNNSFSSLGVDIPTTVVIVVDASNNQLKGEIPSFLCDLYYLYALDLSYNYFTGSIPVCLTNLFMLGLAALDLKQNQLQGVIPSVIFEDCWMLGILSLSGNLLQGPIPQSLSNCNGLMLLDVGNNNLNGTFPHWLDELPELEVLIMGSNNFKGRLMSSNLTNPFPKLRVLDISNNGITGGLPEGLLISLKAMIKVYVPDPKIATYMWVDLDYKISIKAWAKGFELRLDGILDTLVSIDVSRNFLEGTIPEVIGDLVSLRWLNLAHNNFTGSIPPSLGNLSMLESLDLSFNRLDGQIPSELVNLNFLEFFNVSENNLVGQVPKSTQFDTFSDNSYLGNPRLCGDRLTKKCGKKDEPPSSRPAEGSTSGSKFSGFHLWVIVLMGYGCGMLVGSVWGYFFFWESNYYWVERLIFKIEVFIMPCQRRRRHMRRN